jgi:cell division protein FtsL
MTKRYYVNGNTVRELDAPVRQDVTTKEEREAVRRRKHSRNAARRNRQRAMEMSRGYVVFLSICVTILACMAAMYIHVQSQMTTRMKSVASLQSQLIDLQATNDARYKSLTSSVDLNHVKDVAINELGMRYPKENQVIYYSVDNTNYMDQYEDIP